MSGDALAVPLYAGPDLALQPLDIDEQLFRELMNPRRQLLSDDALSVGAD